MPTLRDIVSKRNGSVAFVISRIKIIKTID